MFLISIISFPISIKKNYYLCFLGGFSQKLAIDGKKGLLFCSLSGGMLYTSKHG